MKIFCTLILTVVVAIVVERCWAEFLLVEVDDPALKARTATLDPSQCEWSEWSQGSCSVTCGRGTRTNTAVLVPKEGIQGICLAKQDQEVCECTKSPCPVNCVWGPWKEGVCSKTCGAGLRIDTRTKTQIEENGGFCAGEPRRQVACQQPKCTVSGVECCSDRGVTVSCLGNCAPEDRSAKSIFINTRKGGNCKKFEEIIKECTSGVE